MATQTDSQLVTAATVIQNETVGNANTATRVGTMLNNIIDSKINNDKIVTAITGASNANVPSELAVKTYADTKQAALGFTAENVANKDIDGTLAANSDTKYPSQKATKTYVDAQRPYKIYRALLTQAGGASAPTVNILENTLGETPTWSRVSAGNYRALFTGTGYTYTKTHILMGSAAASNPSATVIGCVFNSAGNEIMVFTYSGGYADGSLFYTAIEIKLYP